MYLNIISNVSKYYICAKKSASKSYIKQIFLQNYHKNCGIFDTFAGNIQAYFRTQHIDRNR